MVLKPLDKIRDLKIVPNTSLTRISSTSKSKTKGSAIILLSTNQNDVVTLLNKAYINPLVYKGYYKDRIYKSLNSRKRLVVSAAENYKLLDSVNSKVTTKNTLKAYNGLNLIYDISEKYNLELQSLTSKQVALLVDTLFNFLQVELDKVKAHSYTDITLVLPISTVEPYREFLKPKNAEPLALLLYAIKRNLQESLKILTDLPICLLVEDKLLKFTLNSEVLADLPQFRLKLESQLKSLYIQSSLVTNLPDQSTSSPNNDDVADKNDQVTSAVMSVNDYYGKTLQLTTNNEGTSLDKDLQSLLDKKLFEKIKADPTLARMSGEEIAKTLSTDPEVNKLLQQFKDIKLIGRSNKNETAMTARFRQKQEEVMSLDDIVADMKKAEDFSIDDIEDDNLNVINTEVSKTTKIKAFDDSYIEKTYQKDIIDQFTAFNNDPDVPLYVTKIERTKATSDKLNKIETYRVTLVDNRGKRNIITIDVPQIIDGKYIYINGGKKIITKQLVTKPVVKVKPDEVYITTSYNKINIQRFGKRLSDKMTGLNKILSKDFKEHTKSGLYFKIKRGNSIVANADYLTSIEYANMSSYLLSITTKQYVINFNQDQLRDYIKNSDKYNNIEYDPENFYPIGYVKNKKAILVENLDSHHIFELGENGKPIDIDDKLSNFVARLIEENTDLKMDDFTVKNNSSLAYTRVYLIGRWLPLIALLGFEKGLVNVLNMYNVKYEFSSKNKSIKLSQDTAKMKFKNGILYYDTTRLGVSLLLSGLRLCNTENYDFKDFNTKEPYLDLFEQLFDSRIIARAFHNTITFLLDPITKDVLAKLNQPTDIYELLLYANDLLEGLDYKRPNDYNTYRVRAAEQVPAMLYNILASYYGNYKRNYDLDSPETLSIPRDKLIKNLMELPTLESASDLNPVLTEELEGKVVFKGLLGQNDDNTYTAKLRAYSDSMRGIITTGTPDSSSVGAVRFLTYNPNIVNTRGFFDTNNPENISTSINNTAEMLTPFVSIHDDPMRQSMMDTQSKHVVPLVKATRPLYGTGVEKSIVNNLPDGFVIRAKKDGKIKSIDEENQLVVIEYTDSSTDIIDLSDVIQHNSGGGFFVNLHYTLLFKEGQRFKKGNVLAKVDDFFKGSNQGDISFSMGHLTKVALTSNEQTYEDSCVITSGLAGDMATKVTMMKEIVLDVNSNILKMAKKGSYIKTGEPLIVYENKFEDDSIADIIDNIDKDDPDNKALSTMMDNLSSIPIKSKYSGQIVDIKIYRNRDIEDFSKSIQKIIKQYESKNKKKEKLINSYVNPEDQHLYSNNIPELDTIKSEKIKGKTTNGILIEFYIEYNDELGIGDKLTAYCALKAVIADTIPEIEAPISEYRPDEHVQLLFSSLSIISRMTNSIYYDLYLNKGLLELKRQISEMIGIKPKLL